MTAADNTVATVFVAALVYNTLRIVVVAVAEPREMWVRVEPLMLTLLCVGPVHHNCNRRRNFAPAAASNVREA